MVRSSIIEGRVLILVYRASDLNVATNIINYFYGEKKMSCNWEDIIQKFQILSEEYLKLSHKKQTEQVEWESWLHNDIIQDHLEIWQGDEERQQHAESLRQYSVKLKEIINQLDSIRKEAELIQNKIKKSLNDVAMTKGINDIILNYINLPIKDESRYLYKI